MLGSIYSGPFTEVDGAGVEITNLGLTGAENPTFDIDLTDTGVIITDIRDGGPFAHVTAPDAFHGIVLSDINDPTFGAEMFANVSLVSYNWGGFDASRVTYDAGHIYVNLMDTPTIAGQTVTLSFDAVVPEPASLALLGTGLLGLARIARRRRA